MQSQSPSSVLPERSVAHDAALSSLTGSANLASSSASSPVSSRANSIANSSRSLPTSPHVVADVSPSINTSASHVNGGELVEKQGNKGTCNTQEKDEASEHVNYDPPANEESKLMNSDSPADLGVVQSLSVSANDEVGQGLGSLKLVPSLEPSDNCEEEDRRDQAPSHPVAKTDLSAVIERLRAVESNPSDSDVWDKGQTIYSNWVNGGGGREKFEWFAEDYENPGFRQKYVSSLYQRRYTTMTNVLSSDKFKFQPSSNTAIVSIGSGPGAELIAVYDHFQQRKDLCFLATDRVEGWGEYIAAINNNQFTFECMDLTYFDTMADLMEHASASCVIISHVQLDFGFPNMVIRLFEELHTSLRCVIVLDRYPIDRKKPQTPNGVSVTRLSGEKFGNDIVLIFTKDDEASSSTSSSSASSSTSSSSASSALLSSLSSSASSALLSSLSSSASSASSALLSSLSSSASSASSVSSSSPYDQDDEVEAMNTAMQDMDLSGKTSQA